MTLFYTIDSSVVVSDTYVPAGDPLKALTVVVRTSMQAPAAVVALFISSQ